MVPGPRESMEGLPPVTEIPGAAEARSAGKTQGEEAPGAVVHVGTRDDGRRSEDLGSVERPAAGGATEGAVQVGAGVLVEMAAERACGPECGGRGGWGGFRGGGGGDADLGVEEGFLGGVGEDGPGVGDEAEGGIRAGGEVAVGVEEEGEAAVG